MAMSKLLSALRGARKIEWILLMAAVAVVVLLISRDGTLIAPVETKTELEARIESVLSMVENAGTVRVLVNEELIAPAAFSSGQTAPVAKGVVIVAEGAEDMRVSMELARAVKTLLNIELEQIEVLTMDGGKTNGR